MWPATRKVLLRNKNPTWSRWSKAPGSIRTQSSSHGESILGLPHSTNMDRETKPAVEYLRETIDDVRLVQQVARISFGHDVGDIKAAEMGKTKKTRKKSAEAAEAHSTKGIKSKHTPRKKAQESEVLSARERREKQP
jgi:hypothetical protein